MSESSKRVETIAAITITTNTEVDIDWAAIGEQLAEAVHREQAEFFNQFGLAMERLGVVDCDMQLSWIDTELNYRGRKVIDDLANFGRLEEGS